MNRSFEGRVAFVTGAARGQGRSHAIAFARAGASVAVSDICEEIDSVPYGLGSEADLAETVRLCEEHGVRVISAPVDVRDFDAVDSFTSRTVAELGKIDVLVSNAGIFTFSPLTEMSLQQFDETIDTNLRGVFHTIKAVVPGMAANGYGRVVLIGSTASLVGMQNIGHYVASKHGVLGLTKALAAEQGPNGITVNCVCPNTVRTRMIENEGLYQLVSPDDPSRDAALGVLKTMNLIPDQWVEPGEVSELVLFLASEQAAHITGADFKIDMGYVAR
jgi:SDR family mycofactocin-dependent oxidoreductase